MKLMKCSKCKAEINYIPMQFTLNHFIVCIECQRRLSWFIFYDSSKGAEKMWERLGKRL